MGDSGTKKRMYISYPFSLLKIQNGDSYCERTPRKIKLTVKIDHGQEDEFNNFEIGNLTKWLTRHQR